MISDDDFKLVLIYKTFPQGTNKKNCQLIVNYELQIE